MIVLNKRSKLPLQINYWNEKTQNMFGIRLLIGLEFT